MAFSTRPFFFLFLLSVLVVFSMQIHARESHFFSKLPKGSPSFVTVDPKKDQENQDPSFVPQTGSGYGLYGHETSYNNNNNEENATSYEPYTTPSQQSQTEERSSEKYPKNGDNNYSYNYRNENNDETGERKNENNYNYNTKAYEEEKEPQRFANRMYNNDNDVEREGMSDTRFMENGNYFYDVNDEANHGHYYAKNQHKDAHRRYGQNNVNVNGGRFYGNDHNEENGFRDPYDSRWEKNMVMNNEQQEFEEEP